ncbi:MAG: hypothetical protein GY845_27555 [Planctomycetes bacterium]|nr:hypothetical protein [Planctomycetota bacterium]
MKTIIHVLIVCIPILSMSCAIGGRTGIGDAEGGSVTLPITLQAYRTYAKQIFNPYTLPVNLYINGHFAGYVPPRGRLIVTLNEGRYIVGMTDPLNGNIVDEWRLEVP